MKITQLWKRNTPSTAAGHSITLTTVYSSQDQQEIDDLEKQMPQGIRIMETEKKKDD